MSDKPEALRLADLCNKDGYMSNIERRQIELELRRLHSEVEALRTDAGRLEWFDRNCEWDGHAWWTPDLVVSTKFDDAPTMDHLRSAIDAAMAKEQTK